MIILVRFYAKYFMCVTLHLIYDSDDFTHCRHKNTKNEI